MAYSLVVTYGAGSETPIDDLRELLGVFASEAEAEAYALRHRAGYSEQAYLHYDIRKLPQKYSDAEWQFKRKRGWVFGAATPKRLSEPTKSISEDSVQPRLGPFLKTLFKDRGHLSKDNVWNAVKRKIPRHRSTQRGGAEK